MISKRDLLAGIIGFAICACLCTTIYLTTNKKRVNPYMHQVHNQEVQRKNAARGNKQSSYKKNKKENKSVDKEKTTEKTTKTTTTKTS